MTSEKLSLEAARQLKLHEVVLEQAKLKLLQADLERLNSKMTKNESLSSEDTKFISELGWLTALSVTVAAVAASI